MDNQQQFVSVHKLLSDLATRFFRENSNGFCGWCTFRPALGTECGLPMLCDYT